MAAETGQPMLFATVALPETLRPFDFYEHYPGRDVPVTTAVRLSSGFPYVAPAARADADGAKGHFTHLVDGGYFDNYGVGTLSAWTHAALMGLAPAERPPRLLVIEICDSEFCSGREPGVSPSEGGPRRAWPYQLVAPLTRRRRDAGRGAAGDQPHVAAAPEDGTGRRTTSASSRSRCRSAPATRRFRGI